MLMVYNNIMKKVGILGGTFDPLHNGHIYLAKTALATCNLDEIMFLPLNVPPHKGTPKADAQTRYNLVKKGISDFPEFWVSDREIKRNGTTYTIDTLLQINAEHPDWDIYYIIGTDSLYDLHKWKQIEKVFSLCTFICMSRPGEDIKDQESYAKKLEKTSGGRIIVIPTMGKDVSSTIIRSAAKHELTALVPEQILDEVTNIYVKEELS